MSKRLLLMAFLLAAPMAAPMAARAGNAAPVNAVPVDAGETVDMESLFPSEEGLIRIEISGVDSRDFLARFMGDTLFIPFTTFCDFLRIKSSTSPDQTLLNGELLPEGNFEISRVTNTATIGSRGIRFSPASIRVVGGETYVEQSLLMELFGLAAYYDPANLKLRISPDEKLPVVQWKRNEERYGLLPAHGRDRGTGVIYPIDRTFFGAPALNWTISNSVNGKMVSTVGGLHYGQQLLWGTLEMNGSAMYMTGLPNQIGHAQIDAARWSYQIPNSTVLSQVQLGTMDLPSGARVHGIGVTNTPLSPRTGYANYQLQGFTRPGWTVELYDGARLVDVTKADSAGRYAFQIQMGYGTIDRTTRELGPYGEVAYASHRLQFNQQMIPAGELEYDVRYGADSLDANSSGNGAARLGFGVFDRLTVAAEARYSTPDVAAWHADSISPRALATLWLGDASSIGLNYAVRQKLIGADFYTVASNNATLRAAIDSLSIDHRTFASMLGASYPIGQFTLGASGSYAKRTLGDEYMVEPQFSGYLGGVSFIGGTRFAWSRPANGEVGTSLDTATGKNVSSSLRLMVAPAAGLLLSAYGAYDFSKSEMKQFDLSAYYQFDERFGLNVNYSAPRFNWSQGLVQAQLSVNLSAVRAIIGTVHQSGVTSSSSYAQGGVLLSTHGVRLYADPVVGQSAVLIDAFNDRNGNGARDNGEELLDAPKARLTMAGAETMSEDGMFRLLPANRECQVEIDRWSYASEDLYPSRTSYNIYTLPSGVNAIEVPFARGYDLSGRCGVEADSARVNESTAFLNGLRVTLRGSGNGSTYEGEVFSDGTIFVPGVAIGTYQIVFDAEQLAARRLCPPAVEGSFTVTDTDHRIPATMLRRCSK